MVVNGSFSSWVFVLSGVPQGSVLGPILFLIYIRHLGKNICSTVLKFADDTKLVARVDSSHAVNILRRDLYSLAAWSEEWLMLFNTDKCSVMHFEYNNEKHKCVLGGRELKELTVERDLGILVQDDLKVSQPCCKVANKGNTVSGVINRAFTLKSKNVILPLYKSLVRPHLDYAIPA